VTSRDPAGPEKAFSGCDAGLPRRRQPMGAAQSGEMHRISVSRREGKSSERCVSGSARVGSGQWAVGVGVGVGVGCEDRGSVHANRTSELHLAKGGPSVDRALTIIHRAHAASGVAPRRKRHRSAGQSEQTRAEQLNATAPAFHMTTRGAERGEGEGGREQFIPPSSAALVVTTRAGRR
jgi:hypothetical protein